ncbi:hypothetical protein K458DRAFT_410133 [Lentithecium fluviatile CBS 122367]|uniref:Uncharacterized protein n=1 Tax=Lentithecium fluviatile CBS 122367 TaxID=1168545 RepID=A0A6G1IF14_9PLEO|nr:hypothetical protein K458DRAFT_410133 [Lentithecium fluviatile CBS 122367]
MHLRRSGRIDKRFHIGFATKNTAELTFFRMFGADIVKRFTDKAIQRFAKALKEQFPMDSKIPTATLVEYFNTRRGRQDQAQLEFSEWLRRRGRVRILSTKATTQTPDCSEKEHKRENSTAELLSVAHDDLTVKFSDAYGSIHGSLGAEQREMAIRSHWEVASKVSSDTQRRKAFADLDFDSLVIDSDDESLPDLSLWNKIPSMISRQKPKESVWDKSHSRRASPVIYRHSVKFVDPVKLAPGLAATPRLSLA